MASCSAYITMKGIAVAAVSAGSNHVGAREMCTPQVSCPPGCATPAEPDESKTLEPASAADIFRISRRLRSPTEWIAILGPLQRWTWKATQRHTGCTEKRNSAHDRPDSRRCHQCCPLNPAETSALHRSAEMTGHERACDLPHNTRCRKRGGSRISGLLRNTPRS